MPVLDAFARSHPGIQVIGVAVEPAQAARDHLATHPVSYPVLIGSDQELAPFVIRAAEDAPAWVGTINGLNLVEIR